MALLEMDGFDMYASISEIARYKFSSYSGMSLSTTGGRWGGGSLTGGNAFAVYTFAGGALTEFYMGIAFKATSSSANAYPVLRFNSATGLECSLYYTVTRNQWQARNGSSTVLATGYRSIGYDKWNFLECRITPDNTTGIFEFWMNGETTPLISETNVDTRATVDTGGIISITLGGNSSSTAWRYDDLYVCDTTGGAPWNTRLGDIRITPNVPNTDAGANDGTRSAGSTNYENVDEVRNSGTDYVDLTDTAGQAEWYGTDAAFTSSDTILGVQSRGIIEVDTGSDLGKFGIRQSSTESFGADQTIPAAADDLSSIFTLDPVAATQLTYSQVNSLDVGYEVV